MPSIAGLPVVRQKPIRSRCFVLALVWTLGSHATAVSADALLTEGDALALGLSMPALRDVAEGAVAQAEAERERARRWPNPVASFQHEETGGATGSTEDYAWVSQTFDLAGRRYTRGRAADERVGAARAEAEKLSTVRTLDIRERFYEALLAEKRAAVLSAAVEHGARIVGIVEKRRQAGEVSGYDLQRVSREQASARARLAGERAARVRAHERLRSLVGTASPSGTPWSAVSGDLLPDEALPPLDELVARLPERPDLRALRANERAARLEISAARRWWLPEVTVGAGVKTVDAGDDRLSGPFLSASVPLPVLDRDQGAALEAAGGLRMSRGQYRLALETAEGELRGLWHETVSVTQAASAFRAAALDTSRPLTETAERAYQAGEMEVLSLLDAHRSTLEAELRVLELQMDARRARIELGRVVGESL